jgi:hypothetical protein
MNRTIAAALLFAASCMAALCATLCVQAQSDAASVQPVNSAVQAVDASVHAEVDGQAPESSPEELPAKRATSLHPAKSAQASMVWPAQVDASSAATPVASTDDKTNSRTVVNSSLRTGTQTGAFSTWQPTAVTADSSDDDSTSARSETVKPRPTHALTGSGSAYRGATPALHTRTAVPPIPDADKTTGLSAPFGGSAAANLSPFAKSEFSVRKDQPGAKRHPQHARKSASSAATNSSLDSSGHPEPAKAAN